MVKNLGRGLNDMKKQKEFKLVLLVLFWISGIILWYPQDVSAANPQSVELKPNKTYTAYDITGDKKKDTIKIKITKDSYSDGNSALSVIINGKVAYSFKNQFFYGTCIRLYTLKNGKPFLYLYASDSNGDGPVCAVFQYKNRKLSKIINFNSLFKGYGTHLYGNVISISGNTITTEYYISSYVLGYCTVRYKYSYKDGTLKRTSSTANFSETYSYGKKTKTFYANKNLTAYTSTRATKKAFTVKRREAVQVDKCYCSGGKMLVRIKYKGKYGWLKAIKGKTWPKEIDKQFSNVAYAG